MAQFEGKYSQMKSENLDEYFKAIGVPYIPRKMICSTSPSLEIVKSEDGEEWTISTSTLLKTSVLKFKLGEEYEETMPGGNIKNITTKEDSNLLTKSVGPNGEEMKKNLEFTEEGCTMTLTHEKSGVIAKRMFKRN